MNSAHSKQGAGVRVSSQNRRVGILFIFLTQPEGGCRHSGVGCLSFKRVSNLRARGGGWCRGQIAELSSERNKLTVIIFISLGNVVTRLSLWLV